MQRALDLLNPLLRLRRGLRIFLRRSLIDMVLLQLHLAHFLTQIELRAVHNLLDRFVGRTALLHHHDLRERQHGHRHRCAVMEQSQRLEQILRGPQRALEHHVREFVYGRSLSSENRTIQTGQIDDGVQQMVQKERQIEETVLGLLHSRLRDEEKLLQGEGRVIAARDSVELVSDRLAEQREPLVFHRETRLQLLCKLEQDDGPRLQEDMF